MSDVPTHANQSVISSHRSTLIWLAVLSLVLLYCFGNSLSMLWTEHWNDPQYSHGYLVPVFALILLWMRWDRSSLQKFDEVPAAARWWGAGLLAAGLSWRLIAARFGMEVPEMVSFLPSLAGIVLLVGGWRLFIWSGPVIAFLVFMFPLPWTLSQKILVPLQGIATRGSTYLLQAMGYGAYREGNIIHIAGVPMEVVDACSGLRMLTVFLALCGAVALIIERPLWERLLVFVSAVPIALAVNITRITTTGMAYYHLGPSATEWVEKVFHDQAGLLMMPLAMGFLFAEIWILGKLFVEDLSEVHAAKPVKTAASPLGGTSQRRVDPLGQRRTARS